MPTTATHTIAATPSIGHAAKGWRRGLGRSLWIPLAIFGVTRIIDALMLVWASGSQQSMPRRVFYTPTNEVFVYSATPADPGYFGVATNWDGQWYQYLAIEGYQQVSADSAWHVIWGWAFPPGYPTLVSMIMDLTGLSFPVAAVATSLLLGAIAVALLFRLAERYVGRAGAAALVALVSLFPSAPLLQVAYSESAALMLIAWSLLHLDRRQYWWALIPLLLLALTRLVTPPLAAVAVLAEVARQRKGDKASPRQWVGLVLYTAAAIAGVFVWSFVAQTQGSGVSRATHAASQFTLGYFGAAFQSAPSRGVFVVIVVGAYLIVTLRQWSRWGPVLTTWAAAYPVFVLLVTIPTTGLVRYLLLTVPVGLVGLLGPLAARQTGAPTARRLGRLGVVVVALVAVQVLWVRYSFILPESGVRLMP